MFRSLGVSARALRCSATLVNGQAFGWQPVLGNQKQWAGVLRNSLILFEETADDTQFRVLHSPPNITLQDIEKDVRDYLRLNKNSQTDIPIDPLTITSSMIISERGGEKEGEGGEVDPFALGSLYTTWSTSDQRFSKVGNRLPGVRVLRQDPVECLFSFLCSSNNNVKRITSMLASLRKACGTLIASYNGEDHFSFPTITAISTLTEQNLRDMGFGYRAKFVVETARMVQEKGGAEWLAGLRNKPRKEVQTELMTLHGVGRKVADCVALFSLDKLDLVPVDTHVLQICMRDYSTELKMKRKSEGSYNTKAAKPHLSDKLYEEIGEFFRGRFGPYAGWAHSVLFTAELPAFASHLLPPPLPLSLSSQSPSSSPSPSPAPSLSSSSSPPTQKKRTRNTNMNISNTKNANENENQNEKQAGTTEGMMTRKRRAR